MRQQGGSGQRTGQAGRRGQANRGRVTNHIRTRIFLVLLGFVYVFAAPAMGLFGALERNEATVAGGVPLNGQSWCLSRSLGLVCTTHFQLKIARRVFSHTEFFGARGPQSLSVLVEQGAPVQVRYNRKACRGIYCTILGAEHRGAVLVPFAPNGTHDALMIWLLMTGGGLCFWSATRRVG